MSGLVIQLILGGVILAALGGAFYSWRSDIKEQGAVEVREEMQRLQAEQDQKNLRLAQQGVEDRDRLLSEAQKRVRRQAVELAAANAARRNESDLRARDDIEYSLWRETRVPVFAANRLRQYAQLTPDEQGRNSLPAGTPIPPVADVPADTGTVDQSWIGRIRAFIDRSTSPGVESK